MVGERERERRALPFFALGPDPSAVPMDDALDRREADPGARELAHGMQALKAPMVEYACIEGDQGMKLILQGARADEKAAEQKK